MITKKYKENNREYYFPIMNPSINKLISSCLEHKESVTNRAFSIEK